MGMKKLIDEAILRAIETKEVAGVNFLVYKDGKELIYAEGGVQNIDDNKPFKRDTIFRLFSQTKPITAAAAMFLVERGMLDLTDEVSKFLPAYKNIKTIKDGQVVNCNRPMLVKDLLDMTSGLVYPDINCEAGRQTTKVFLDLEHRIDADDSMTTREVADQLAECVLDFEPGSSFRYGTSADVLGAVIEVVAGKKFGDFLREEIFEPLEMKDTAFYVPEDKMGRLATAYRTSTNKDGETRLKEYDWNNLGVRRDAIKPPAFESGGAGLLSTVDDYMKFGQMLLNGGRFKDAHILKPATVRFMTSGELSARQQVALEDWTGLWGYSYNNLLRVCKNSSRSSYISCNGEYGWDGWLGAYFSNFPNENMTIIMGTQKVDGGTFALTRKLRNIVLSHVL
ncbi:MAG: beta-lactamase family protein [Butyrivibrio sp.]|nr:beta-lactamase family protein [Butyrivibrio sp.]